MLQTTIATKPFNPHLSVDCVIFGFDGASLRVLLIKRKGSKQEEKESEKYKLPGDLIIRLEDLYEAAVRVLKELTGLSDIFMKQFHVFGSPDRMANQDDHDWLEQTSGVTITRVVTTAYYSLIRLDKSKSENAARYNASWHDINDLPNLAFDHREIIETGISTLQYDVQNNPICFELLPGKFTIRQIQTLYEVIFNQSLDNRNFRKKLLKAPYIEALNEKQKGVAHKPAMFYRFNREEYQKSRKDVFSYNF
jgi:8-oxo-dGTP diphosphatase